MLKNIIFDLDDTLLDFKRGEYEGLRDIFIAQGIKDLDKVFQTYNKINTQVWLQIENGHPAQPLLNTRFSDTLAQFGISADGGQLEKTYRAKLNQNYHVIPGAIELLDSLKQQNYQFIVGTNGVAKTQYARLQGAGLMPYFDDVFISEEIGYNKPNPQFFTHILKHGHHITRNNTVMVGDRLSADIQGAVNAALPNIWFNPRNEQSSTTIQPDYVAQNYHDMLTIITQNMS